MNIDRKMLNERESLMKLYDRLIERHAKKGNKEEVDCLNKFKMAVLSADFLMAYALVERVANAISLEPRPDGVIHIMGLQAFVWVG